MSVALGVERSLSGQAWRWRRPQGEEKAGLALVDELLLGRGVALEELERYRSPTIRNLLPVDCGLSHGGYLRCRSCSW